MNASIANYNNSQLESDRELCALLADQITGNLNFIKAKIWHAHPVWFINGNPIVGYSKQKPGIRLMFWSGVSFDESDLKPSASGKFKDASIFYSDVNEVDTDNLKRWFDKSKTIQWDYKNIVKNKGILNRGVKVQLRQKSDDF